MRLPFKLDGGTGARAALGLIALRADETIEGELRRLLALPGVALHVSRIACAAEISPGGLAAMRTELSRSAGLLPAGLAAVGFGCTSGATVIGAAEVARLIQVAQPGARVGEPLTAAKAALRALGIRRPALITPYAPAVSAALRAALEADGATTIAGFGSFEEADDRRVARIAPESCLDAIITTARSAECDGAFIACTNLRALEVIASAEAALGVPVISSNQALGWQLLRLSGISDAITGFGRLLTAPGWPEENGLSASGPPGREEAK